MLITADLATMDWTDKAVLAMTDDQQECALQTERLYRAYCDMIQPQNPQHKAQSAYTVCLTFKDMQRRHPDWIKSMNRYLAQTGARDADVTAWARQAWRVYCAWTAGKPSACRDIQPETGRESDYEDLP